MAGRCRTSFTKSASGHDCRSDRDKVQTEPFKPGWFTARCGGRGSRGT